MRLRTIGLAAALSTALFQTSSAVVRPKGADQSVVATGKAPRMHRDTAWSRASQLAAVGLPGWTALWDRDTNIPVRLFGPAPFFAGAMQDGAIAETAARQFLAQHIALLAPGSRISDFVVVSNQVAGADGVRSLGFQQLSGGVKVLGGAVSFSFKNDRMIMVGSTALPGVSVAALPPTRVDAGRLASSATSWLASAGFSVAVTQTSADRVIVPIIHPRGAQGPDIEYRLAEQLVVESTADEGRWNVWLDAATASPILRKSMVQWASGTILYNVPDRHPSSTRSPKPAARARHTIDGVVTLAELDGTVTWAGTSAATVAPGLTGPSVAISNKAGALAADSLTLAVAGTLTWDKTTDEFGDAQLASFVFASQAKAFVHDNLDANLAWADTSLLPVNVNINQTCNANYNGSSINFYRATTNLSGTQCQNTGRIADVVYHEFGHSVHHHAVIDGVGQVDPGVGEGMADVLAALITRDHGMGRGFFMNDQPLRDLDSATTLRYPDDITGEEHNDGEIVGQAFWDMKKELIAKLGAEPAELQARKLYYGIIQRSVDIPTTYVEALVSDDDDGDLSNGTPNMCAINAGYGAHGLANAASALGLSPPTREDFTVSLTANPPSGAATCPGAASVTKAAIEWKKRGGTMSSIDLAVADTTYSGKIPTQPEGTIVQYKVVVTLSDGSSISYPNNAADPFYEFYVGEVTKLWCADFETGAGDWTHGALPANRDEWQVGPPQGLGGDPKNAFGGTSVFGTDLMGDGLYRGNITSWAESPEIDLAGHTDVRLQYQRWLGIEDGFFDNARILVNGTKLWENFASAEETANGVDHLDKEWRFQDVDLAAQSATGKVKLRFELDSDQGLSYGGWTMDDVCVVAGAKAPTCGNGTLDEGETCDDGNIDDGDGCSPTCGLPGEDETGCCSVGATPGGAALLSLFTIGMLIRRRRR